MVPPPFPPSVHPIVLSLDAHTVPAGRIGPSDGRGSLRWSRLGLDRLVEEEGRKERVVHSRGSQGLGARAGLGRHGVAAADDESRAVVCVRLVEEQS